MTDSERELIRQSVLMDINRERLDQIRKWGHQDHDPGMWLAILTEELGEVGKEIAEGRVKPFEWTFYRNELVQLGAVAAAAVEAIDVRDAFRSSVG